MERISHEQLQTDASEFAKLQDGRIRIAVALIEEAISRWGVQADALPEDVRDGVDRAMRDLSSNAKSSNCLQLANALRLAICAKAITDTAPVWLMIDATSFLGDSLGTEWKYLTPEMRGKYLEFSVSKAEEAIC